MFTIEGLGLKWDEENQTWQDSTGKKVTVRFRDAGWLPAMDLEDEVERMTKQELIQTLEFVKGELENVEGEFLSGHVDGAIKLAWEAVCHAIDFANVTSEMEK